MKQCITWDQFSEVTKEQRRKLEDDTDSIFSRAECFNIGRMIEILEDKIFGIELIGDGWQIEMYKDASCVYYVEKELCDALWTAIKQVLEG